MYTGRPERGVSRCKYTNINIVTCIHIFMFMLVCIRISGFGTALEKPFKFLAFLSITYILNKDIY